MIITITPNPSVDRTFEVEHLERGAVLRASGSRLDPGGKGINVARALHLHGHAAAAVVPIGGSVGEHLQQLLSATGLQVITVPIAGDVRSNVTIAELDGTVTKLNEGGPRLSEEELAALLRATTSTYPDVRWVVASGSLPPGVHHSLFAEVVQRAHAAGARVAVDTSGDALATVLPATPDVVKPNAEELAELTGRPLTTLGDVLDAAGEVRERGARAVLASLGPDGVVLQADGIALHGELGVAEPRSTVGAGDATLAGYLTVPDDPVQAVRAAVAFGAAAVQRPGSQMPEPADLRPADVTVDERPDRSRPLRAPVHAPLGVVALSDPTP